MKKTPIKFLTICLFVTLIIGFVLYKAGFLFPKEKKIIIKDELATNAPEMNSREQLNIFHHLNSAGGFTPENFDTVYVLAPHYHEAEETDSDHFFLSSSKSMLAQFEHFDYFSEMLHEPFEFQVKEQFKSKPAN